MRPGSYGSLPLLLVACVAAPAFAAAPADAASSSRRCSQLKGRDLYPKNPRITVVRRTRTVVNDVGYEGTRTSFVACYGRGGRVRTVDHAGDNGVSTSAITPGASAGRFFLLGRSDDSPDRSYGSLRVYDARSGRSHRLYSDSAGEDADVAQFAPESVVLDGSGATAVLFADPSTDAQGPASTNLEPGLPPGTTTYVAAFDARGRRTVLDTGAADIGRSSLRLAGGVLRWTHGAETRTYALRSGG